ncbi:uncharacterized protein MONBRDRAFT_38871 [Monosiga brevicollis MX1]|uniref:Ribosomal RNA-processing protein 40 n=1 Tax=Monosiga brevicollis TaxID=81824 RepID=A9VAP4_MONBE|nr:uncharacterized protein MONBRDRAFT_38871 [Monosiga brevicollis MX1]EDQ85408.1 predicted protein [Monosiga brevicollis MX1]|eukprot:XP_001749819.1 hypothetical protein [Monosiga brevicollis MX1]
MAEGTGPRVVVPGDRFPLPDSGKVVLGPGLTTQQSSHGSEGVVTHGGILRQKGEATFWVDIATHNPQTAEGDQVLGIIIGNAGEGFLVDIGGASNALLPGLAFEGATRRNRPRLNPGDLVLARLKVANRDMDPELTCVTSGGKSAGMGHLEGGLLREISLGLCRRLRGKNCRVLTELGSRKKFELCVGMNGRMWLKTEAPMDAVLLANAIEASELMSDKQVTKLVNRISSGWS